MALQPLFGGVFYVIIIKTVKQGENMTKFYWAQQMKRFYWYSDDGIIYCAKSTTGDETGLIEGTSIQKVYNFN
jgi:hypothetical protein